MEKNKCSEGEERKVRNRKKFRGGSDEEEEKIGMKRKGKQQQRNGRKEQGKYI